MIPLRSTEQAQLPPVELRAFGRTGWRVSAFGFGGANIGFTDLSEKFSIACLARPSNWASI